MIKRLIQIKSKYHAIMLDEDGRIHHEIFSEEEKARKYLLSLRKKNKIIQYKV